MKTNEKQQEKTDIQKVENTMKIQWKSLAKKKISKIESTLLRMISSLTL